MLTSETSSDLKQGPHAPVWAVVFGANTGGPQALAQDLRESLRPAGVRPEHHRPHGRVRALLQVRRRL